MQVSERVAAHHSQFLFGPIEDHAYGTLRLPTDKSDGVVHILISPALKPAVLTLLRKVLDTGAQTMFPDLPGFASAFGASPFEDPYRW